MTSKKDSHDISKAKLQRASMALDNLIWALQSVKLDTLREAADALRAKAEAAESRRSTRTTSAIDPNKQFLIGSLPRLFQDKKLFPQNDDIVDFAASALGLEMNRSEKRSRYEIIGKVVCETDELDESRLTLLVAALEQLVGNKEKLAQMAERKKAGGFSWNETIQELLKL